MEKEFGLPVVSIVQLQHLIIYAKDQSASASASAVAAPGGAGVSGVSLADIEAYRAQYGVDY